MASHLHSILCQWYPRRDECRWVLATVIHVEGSNYRKVGAIMLTNELGQFYGLISGGCLEKSLLTDVKKVLTYDQPRRVYVDSSDDSESSWGRALGCGGKLTVLLQPVCNANDYQQLAALHRALQVRSAVSYVISVEDHEASNNQALSPHELAALGISCARVSRNLIDRSGRRLLIIAVQCQTHLVLFGGGVDAIPLVQMADIMGWRVTLVDHRAGYAFATSFPSAHAIVRAEAGSSEVAELADTADAAIVMTHNMTMDAAALCVLQDSKVRYVGLLGPAHRKCEVLKLAGMDVNSQANNSQSDNSQSINGQANGNFIARVYGPMGLNIGGDLPESIALSALAQCHQILETCELEACELETCELIAEPDELTAEVDGLKNLEENGSVNNGSVNSGSVNNSSVNNATTPLRRQSSI